MPYERSHSVIAEYKQYVRDCFGALRCEACRWSPPCGPAWDGILHAHHVVPLSDGGDDARSNLVVLCPNCHALAHKVWAALRAISGPLSGRSSFSRRELLLHLKSIRDDAAEWMSWRDSHLATREARQRLQRRRKRRAAAQSAYEQSQQRTEGS